MSSRWRPEAIETRQILLTAVILVLAYSALAATTAMALPTFKGCDAQARADLMDAVACVNWNLDLLKHPERLSPFPRDGETIEPFSLGKRRGQERRIRRRMSRRVSKLRFACKERGIASLCDENGPAGRHGLGVVTGGLAGRKLKICYEEAVRQNHDFCTLVGAVAHEMGHAVGVEKDTFAQHSKNQNDRVYRLGWYAEHLCRQRCVAGPRPLGQADEPLQTLLPTDERLTPGNVCDFMPTQRIAVVDVPAGNATSIGVLVPDLGERSLSFASVREYDPDGDDDYGFRVAPQVDPNVYIISTRDGKSTSNLGVRFTSLWVPPFVRVDRGTLKLRGQQGQSFVADILPKHEHLLVAELLEYVPTLDDDFEYFLVPATPVWDPEEQVTHVPLIGGSGRAGLDSSATFRITVLQWHEKFDVEVDVGSLGVSSGGSTAARASTGPVIATSPIVYLTGGDDDMGYRLVQAPLDTDLHLSAFSGGDRVLHQYWAADFYPTCRDSPF